MARVSVVIPCYNEAACLDVLHARVSAAAHAVVGEDYEIVLINDGSRDKSWEVMQRLSASDPRLVAINLSRNHGHQLHEMVRGTAQELKEHAALMQRFPGMEHSDPNMAHVKPGATGEIVWQFDKPGEYQFACLIPGHFEAGMVGKLVVE